jgi:hypothetical protein
MKKEVTSSIRPGAQSVSEYSATAVPSSSKPQSHIKAKGKPFKQGGNSTLDVNTSQTPKNAPITPKQNIIIDFNQDIKNLTTR